MQFMHTRLSAMGKASIIITDKLHSINIDRERVIFKYQQKYILLYTICKIFSSHT